MKQGNLRAAAAIYFLIIAAAFTVSVIGAHLREKNVTRVEMVAAPDVDAKPNFSLSTNRTYGTQSRARVWVNYQAVNYLDFRVYRVNDPFKFFKQLDNPHQMGEREKTEAAATHQHRASILERLSAIKTNIFRAIKNYFREQLRRESRISFNQKFRNDENSRSPLNVADYARVPLLNPDQLVSSWREQLPPLDNAYDTVMVPLGKREAGVYLVEATNEGLRAYTIAIISDLTMISKAAPNGDMLVYAVDRKTGAPRANVKVEIARGKETLATGATAPNGIFQTQIAKKRPNQQAQRTMNGAAQQDEENAIDEEEPTDALLVMASERDDFTINDLASFGMGEGGGEENDQSMIGYIYTERPVYRPNQKVFFKGILRKSGENGYELLKARSVDITVEDPNGSKVLEREFPLSARGTFNGETEVSGTAPLGNYRIIARAGEAEASGYFEVQEYKKPEYKVTVTTPKKFVSVGQTTKFTIDARYFFGAPVNDADVKYYIYRAHYYPPWWDEEEAADETDETDEAGDYYGYGNDMVKDGQGRTDKNGHLEVEFKVPEADENDPYDYTYRLEAQVTDAARRSIEGKASFTGTRGQIIANVRADRYVYTQGDTAKLNIKTSDYEGHPVAAKVTLKFVERRWDKTPQEGGGYDYKMNERELSSAGVETNAQGEAFYEYPVSTAGSIYVETIVTDNDHQYVSNGESLWVTNQQEQWSDYAYQDYGAIKLIADKKSYRPGETAHVLAMLPTDKAHLLVTTELDRVMTARVLDAHEGRTLLIDVPIEARYAPNVYLNVSYIRDGEMYTSDRSLNVPARDKLLSLEIIPNKNEYKPRETASYTLLARNADGSPAANAEVSLGVVDEAIYSIRPESVRAINKEFYGHHYNSVQTNFAVSYYFDGYAGDKKIELARANRRSYQLADFKNEAQYQEPAIRKEFKDTAFWQPDVITNTDGKAIVKVELPDNLTTWRATARAVTTDTHVGSSMGRVVARKDLIMRLETPRFLTEGDTVTLSGIVHNYLNAAKQTQISINVSGVQLLDPATQTVTIDRQGQQRIDWRVTAPATGEVQLLAKALTDTESDAVELKLEIVPRGLKVTKGETATLADDNAEKSFTLNLPANADGRARMLRLEAAPTIAGTLFGALDYLTSYPYGCTEQTMSSFLPNVIVTQALRDVKSAQIRAGNDLAGKVERGLARLYAYQHEDGGWGWWKDDKTDAFMTAYVVDGLTLAASAGYGVDANRTTRARSKLKEMLDSNKDGAGQTIDLETRAYMIYALTSGGEDVGGGYVNDLYNKRGQLQPYGRALLALALKKRGDDERARLIARDIESSARVNDFDANWQSRRRAMLDFTETNDTEATALSVKALAQINPQSSILARAARWLVTNRPFGDRWNSTKDTAFAIYGLTDYLRVSRELEADYDLEVYLNGAQVTPRHITSDDARSAQTFLIERKASDLGATNDVRVVKRGRGTLYFTARLEYFTNDEAVAAQASPQLRVTREYWRLRVVESNEEGGKAKWSLEPLRGEIHSGDTIVAKLRVQGTKSEYLMIEDPIPAGCEQIERTSGINLDYSEGHWSDWYSAREFRDQRTVLFVREFDGDATYQYAMRVTVPGDFRVAPTRAELMYQPMIQANTASTMMKILEAKQ